MVCSTARSIGSTVSLPAIVPRHSGNLVPPYAFSFLFLFLLVEIVSFLAYFLRGVSRWPGPKIEANQDPPTSQAKGVGEVKGEIWT